MNITCQNTKNLISIVQQTRTGQLHQSQHDKHVINVLTDGTSTVYLSYCANGANTDTGQIGTKSSWIFSNFATFCIPHDFLVVSKETTVSYGKLISDPMISMQLSSLRFYHVRLIADCVTMHFLWRYDNALCRCRCSAVDCSFDAWRRHGFEDQSAQLTIHSAKNNMIRRMEKKTEKRRSMNGKCECEQKAESL